MAIDKFGRSIHYLRISLTDHCNLRCIYCMPEDQTFRPNADLMQDDEIQLLTQLFAGLGFDKIRLTGGEPTVRAHVVDIIRNIAQTLGIRSVSMTTNGLLLSRLAEPLAEAGLQRVNISIDTLNPDKFKRLTRWGKLEDVWNGINAAEKAGLTPIKLNAVVVKGYNEPDVVDLARLTLDHPWQVRFIEMMPFAGATNVQTGQVITAAQIKDSIESEAGKMEIANDGKLDGEARLFRFPNGKGDVGFISSVTAPFCASCTRARLTADGRLRLCLLREKEVDLLTPLRAGATLDDLRQIILDGVWEKPWGHGLAEGVIPLNRVMNEIGG
ncbi:MAG: GTP 3',8-cyclase MoaA [Anaerolineales bacterium]|jgi:cyclic pyranopterin phosphate synthase